mmetsp:Transcript_19152/g.16033  ORF Transcript_19152/g.16033 Transcript_19152/m.16033 type:complete len:80 (+) Transcript_19152:116-355(+)
MTEQEVLHSDAIVIPVSFILLALVVRSWRMILIPLASIIITARITAIIRPAPKDRNCTIGIKSKPIKQSVSVEPEPIIT